MDAEKYIHTLESFPLALDAAIVSTAHADATWRPADGAWSILEVVTHLADEEELDFKVRLRSTLENQTQQWPGIDPEAWATQRNYNAGDLRQSFSRFRSERAKSIQWLRSLDNPDWSIAHTHPRVGPVPAGDLLAAWTAHDWFHLRQITKRRLQLIERDAEPFSIGYAGGTI